MGELSIRGYDGSLVNLVGVASIGVAGNFLVINYEDGVVVIKGDTEVNDAQFTPTPSEIPQGDPDTNEG